MSLHVCLFFATGYEENVNVNAGDDKDDIDDLFIIVYML